MYFVEHKKKNKVLVCMNRDVVLIFVLWKNEKTKEKEKLN